jgi:hypothetical protein
MLRWGADPGGRSLSGLTIGVLDEYILYLHTHFVPRKTRRIGGLDGQSSPICPFRRLFCPFHRCTTLRGNQRVLCSSVLFNHESRLFLRFECKEQASTSTKTRANHNGQLWRPLWRQKCYNMIRRPLQLYYIYPYEASGVIVLVSEHY